VKERERLESAEKAGAPSRRVIKAAVNGAILGRILDLQSEMPEGYFCPSRPLEPKPLCFTEARRRELGEETIRLMQEEYDEATAEYNLKAVTHWRQCESL